MNKNALILGLSVVTSTVTGAAVGYFLTKKQLETKYSELAQQEIAEAKKFYAAVRKSGPFETPEKAVKELIGEDPKLDAAVKALTNYQGVSINPGAKDDDTGLIVKNVWKQPKPSLRDIDENYPHVIDEDEFLGNETGYDQVSMTWYAGDGVLADEKDEPIDDDRLQDLVGNALKTYDDMAEEAHILYVRNNDLKLEIEISRSMGKFSTEVLGVTDD